MRILSWFFINGIFAVAMYFGFYQGMSGAQNIVQLWAWFTIVLSGFVMSDAAVNAAIKTYDKPKIPASLDVVFDTTVVCVLAWYGWMWTALFYAVHMILLAGHRQKVLEVINAKKEK